jgi:hypothetical protein
METGGNQSAMIALLITVFSIIARLLPHPPNFTPVGSTALFGGTYLDKRWALVLPIAIMVVSDWLIGFDSWTSRAYVYSSFLLTGVIGLWLRSHKNFKNVVLATFLSSLAFFLITNFGVWAHSGMYQKTWDGLMQCYLLAVPFFRNSLLGDFFYTGIFFGAYEISLMVIRKKQLAFQESS